MSSSSVTGFSATLALTFTPAVEAASTSVADANEVCFPGVMGLDITKGAVKALTAHKLTLGGCAESSQSSHVRNSQ